MAPGPAVLLLTLAVAAAAGPASAAPETATAAVARATLANGLTVLVRENPTAPVVAIDLMVRTGTRVESRQTAGISNLLQLMVVRGTTSKNGTEIVEAADRMGGSIDAWGDVDGAEIAATALARHWVEMLRLVADVALNPTIPEGTTRAVQDFLLKQIRNRAEKPYDAGTDFLLGRLFGDHPYAWNPSGRKDSVERLTREALVAFYRQRYVPAGMVLAISGRVKTAEVMAEAGRLFGGLPAVAAPPIAPPPPPPAAVTREVIEVAGAQAQILIGGFAPTLAQPDHAAVKVLATVLGGGMAGRFFSELRDKQGLAYTTGMAYPSRLDRGYIVAHLGTAPENVERAEAALRSELDRIQREPVPDAELGVAKSYLLGNLAMDRRTNARQAWYLSFYELAGVGHEFLDRYTAQVKAVTAGDVQRVARQYLATLRTVIVRPPAR